MLNRLSAMVAVIAGFTWVVGGEPPPAAPGPDGGAGRGPVEIPKPARERPAQPRGDARVDLRPRFELGETVRYVMRQVSDQVVPNQEDPKDPHKTRQEQTVGLKMTTKAVDKESGEATVEVVYESIKAKMDGPLGLIEFDSTKPGGPGAGKPAKRSDDPLDAINAQIEESFKKMVGTTMTLKVAKDGRIVSVTGGESLVPTGVPGVAQAWGDAAKQLEGLFGPISSNSTKGFDGTARVGEKWTHRDSLSVGPLGGLEVATTYELRSHQGGVAKVYFNGRAEKRSSGEASLVSVDEAGYSGQYAWDTRRGQLLRCEMEQKTTLSGALTNGKPSTAVSTLVLERVEKR